jgi:hypothetical protein
MGKNKNKSIPENFIKKLKLDENQMVNVIFAKMK